MLQQAAACQERAQECCNRQQRARSGPRSAATGSSVPGVGPGVLQQAAACQERAQECCNRQQRARSGPRSAATGSSVPGVGPGVLQQAAACQEWAQECCNRQQRAQECCNRQQRARSGPRSAATGSSVPGVGPGVLQQAAACQEWAQECCNRQHRAGSGPLGSAITEPPSWALWKGVRLAVDLVSLSSRTSDVKNGTLVATLSGAIGSALGLFGPTSVYCEKAR